MQVARLIRALKELYGVKRGNNQNLGGASDKMSEALGLNERHIRRLDKLNDLIPEFQDLVQSDKLDATKATEAALLSEETQRALFNSFKEKLNELTVVEMRDLRKKLQEAEKEKAAVQKEADSLRERLSKTEACVDCQ